MNQYKLLDTIKSSCIIKNFTFNSLFLKEAAYLSTKKLCSRFNPKTRMNYGSIYIYRWYWLSLSKRTLDLFLVFTVIKQSFWFAMDHFHQMVFTCVCTALKKYADWFNIVPILLYIVFGPWMNHIEDFISLQN